jgi:ATP-dependent helicase/DNAse subunit B
LASKGDKAVLGPQALRLYADGHNLTSIGEQLGVSVTSLARWKNETKAPSADLDDWDKARQQKRGNIARLRDLFEDQLAYLEELHASERSSMMMDTLSKLGSLLEKWDKLEKAQRVAEEVTRVVQRAGLTSETADEIRRQILGIGD